MQKKIVVFLSIILAFTFGLCLYACDFFEDDITNDTAFKIVYVLDGGVAENPDTYNSESESFTLNNPSKLGYEFIGWTFEGQEKPSRQVIIEKGSTGNKSFTANYNVIRYTLTVDYAGGEISEENPATYTVEDSFVLKNPTKEGYSFAGWTFEGQITPLKSVSIKKGTTGNKSFTAHFIEKIVYKPLKLAVFADVQLTTDRNQDSTANAYIALKQHFNYAKEISADVLLMNGDIVNNAVTDYYEYFEKALKEVYGEDESAYPEFVFNMGNHEWWGSDDNKSSEQENKGAVALFTKYARIDSDKLVHKSEVKYYLDENSTLPSYMKVIEGVPFIAVSACNSSGLINEELMEEISLWLAEANQLESVKNGGPIYVLYHYPIMGVTFNGEHTETPSLIMDELLRDYPNAIVFTGDTHYNAINERTINQIDYTSINVGTSSYSRAVSVSATEKEFMNVNFGSGKSGAGRMLGDINFKNAYTPTIMVITTDDNFDKINVDRYFTTNDPKAPTKLGKTWEIGKISSKEDFVFTDDRIENVEWANWAYGKDGLNWADGESVKFNLSNDGTKMIVQFNDVIDFNNAEYYEIEVKNKVSGEVATYNYMSHYYKYEPTSHVYNVILEEFPTATDYMVKVTAYDFFDNPSTNSLTATAKDSAVNFPDEIDDKTLSTYSDIAKTVNYEVKKAGSNSSVEYYFKGTKKFGTSGMILDRIINVGSDDLKEYLTIKDWSAGGILSIDVKNNNNYELYFSVSVIVKNENGGEKWLSDGNVEYRRSIQANSDWKTLSWNLKDLFNITSDSLLGLSIKVFLPDSAVDVENGYEMSFFIDNLDVVSYTLTYDLDDGEVLTQNPTAYTNESATFTLNNPVKAGYKFIGWTFEGQSEPLLNVEIQSGSIGNKTFKANYREILENEYQIFYHLDGGIFETDNRDVYLSTDETFTLNNPVKDGFIFIGWTYLGHDTPEITVQVIKGTTGNLEFTANYKEDVHKNAFKNTLGQQLNEEGSNRFSTDLNKILSFEYKLEEPNETPENSKFAFMIFDGKDWTNWVNYIEINAYDNTTSADFVNVEPIDGDDGWYKVTINLAKALICKGGDRSVVASQMLTSIYATANRFNCVVSFDNFVSTERPAHADAFSIISNEAIHKSNLFETSLEGILSFEYKLVTPNETQEDSSFAFMIFDDKDWDNWVEYITINAYSNTANKNYVQIWSLNDGWYKVVIDLTNADIHGDKEAVSAYVLNSIYSLASRIKCSVLLDNFNSESTTHSNAFKAGGTKENLFEADFTNTLSFEYRLSVPNTANENPSYLLITFYDQEVGLNEAYVNYLKINLNDNTLNKPKWATISALDDGWYEVEIDLSEVTMYKGEIDKINSIFVRNGEDWTNCVLYLDNFTVI